MSAAAPGVDGGGAERRGRSVTVRVPATSANLGPGYDAFGLALGLHDEVEVTVEPGSGVRVEVDGEGADDVARDERNLVARALLAAFEAMGEAPGGLALRCTNRIPHGRGLGSSAAAIVAGIVAARGLVDGGASRLDDEAALALASRMEGHPDNVAACLLGGFTIAWLDGAAQTPRAVRLAPSPAVSAVVLVPAQPVSTEVARGLLPETVPHADAARNSGRSALLVEAISRRPELLLPATEDWLHQRFRATAMPASAQAVATLRDAGIAAVVSGAGPTVLALGEAEQVTRVAELAGAQFQALPLELVAGGATLLAG